MLELSASRCYESLINNDRGGHRVMTYNCDKGDTWDERYAIRPRIIIRQKKNKQLLSQVAGVTVSAIRFGRCSHRRGFRSKGRDRMYEIFAAHLPTVVRSGVTMKDVTASPGVTRGSSLSARTTLMHRTNLMEIQTVTTKRSMLDIAALHPFSKGSARQYCTCMLFALLSRYGGRGIPMHWFGQNSACDQFPVVFKL